MPTPVSTARQCLTPEAVRALDDAVAVARRRAHAQTTSLHLVSAFLALPSSALSDACARARSSAYSPRLQLKALDLCFSVALDRLPSSHLRPDDPPPPVSNSLMAAIKRSQANQRRLPEPFHLHHLPPSPAPQSSLSAVKVELLQLILSILDDPVVSRVFGEAGFRSWDIKVAIIRPPAPVRRCLPPPMFLCNFDQSHRSLGFPVYECSRRIGEVLVRKNGRNPLVIGGCASDAVRGFSETAEKGRDGVLPRVKFVSVEEEVSRFVSGSASEVMLCARLEELGELSESREWSGVVIGFGELQGFVQDGSSEGASCVVLEVMRLLKRHSGKLWLMAEAARYETYLRFLTRFPSIEKDWDLHLLPTTSLSQTCSLKEPFVPFGGFFPTLSDFEGPILGSAYQSISRCHFCNEKYEQELSAISKGGCLTSVADQFQGSLPPWMQTAELCGNTGLDITKAKDGVLNAIQMGLQRKWNDICRRLHRNSPMPGADTNRVPSGIWGFTILANGKDTDDSHGRNSINASPREAVFPSMLTEFQKINPPSWNMPLALVSEAKSENYPSKLHMKPSRDEFHQNEGHHSPTCPPSNSRLTDGHASPSSAISVMTDIGLGMPHSSVCGEPNIYQAHKEQLHNFPVCSPTEIGLVNENLVDPPTISSSCFGHDLSGKFDPRDFKTIWKGLTEKVGRQEQAVCTVSQTINRCRTGDGRHRGASLRGDIWFSFLGPDRVAKKRLAVALAELIFGCRKNLICVDLIPRNGLTQSPTILGCQEINGYDVNFRGKTVIDFIAGEISKRPLSVVFLENVDKADLVAQKRLSQAIKTGKFSDSHGRQIGINNLIFVMTSNAMKGNKKFSSSNETGDLFEEKILAAQFSQFQMLIGYCPDNITLNYASNVLITSRKDTSRSVFANKQKPISTASDLTGQYDAFEMAEEVHKKTSYKYLDLNLPVEELEVNDTDWGSNEGDSTSEKSEGWLEEFINQVDETVVFEPFDFYALTDELLKGISKCFQNSLGHEGLLEIDSEVMEQILAAAWLSDSKRAVEDWVELVLGRSFSEALQRYSLSSARSILKLVTCEGVAMDEQAPGIRLPARIILN